MEIDSEYTEKSAKNSAGGSWQQLYSPTGPNMYEIFYKTLGPI